jgi:uncharacterized protein (UPF0212 family)
MNRARIQITVDLRYKEIQMTGPFQCPKCGREVEEQHCPECQSEFDEEWTVLDVDDADAGDKSD